MEPEALEVVVRAGEAGDLELAAVARARVDLADVQRATEHPMRFGAEGRPDRLRDALEAAERGAARVFLEGLGRSRANVLGQVDAKSRDEEARLLARIRQIDDRIEGEQNQPIERRDRVLVARLFDDRTGAEEELKETEAKLRQVQKMDAIGRLAGGIAHDFNNILTAIYGYADLLLSDLDPEDPRRRDVEEIRLLAQRAANLTRQAAGI